MMMSPNLQLMIMFLMLTLLLIFNKSIYFTKFNDLKINLSKIYLNW